VTSARPAKRNAVSSARLDHHSMRITPTPMHTRDATNRKLERAVYPRDDPRLEAAAHSVGYAVVAQGRRSGEGAALTQLA